MEKTRKNTSIIFMAHTVPGYVVNVYDLVNFDIDLGSSIPPDIGTPIAKKYSYADYYDKFLCEGRPLIQKVGYATRCHLRGLSLEKSTSKKFLKASTFVKFEIERLLNRNNTVMCAVAGVDVYSRLLVDIYITIGDEIINLREFLLRMQSQLEVKLFRTFDVPCPDFAREKASLSTVEEQRY